MIKYATLAALVGMVLGAVGGWWYALPPEPWLLFHRLTAVYELGSRDIELRGYYTVEKECRGDLDVIWRTEAIASDGQLATYGPKPGMPPLTHGPHVYVSSIPLVETIRPDGWVVRVIATCPSLKPETVVSPAAPVRVTG